MSYFNIRPFESSQEVSIYDNVNVFKCPLEVFNILEKDFKLEDSISHLQYTPGDSFIIIKNGNQEVKAAKWPQADVYIGKLVLYIDQYENYKKDNQPAYADSLEEAKAKKAHEIYKFATGFLEQETNNYAAPEKDTWRVVLQEAIQYLETKDIKDAPNIYTQEKVRLSVVGADTPELLAALESRCQVISEKSIALITKLNTVIGVRGRYLDVVSSFAPREGESEIDTIKRLAALDHSLNWPT